MVGDEDNAIFGSATELKDFSLGGIEIDKRVVSSDGVRGFLNAVAQRGEGRASHSRKTGNVEFARELGAIELTSHASQSHIHLVDGLGVVDGKLNTAFMLEDIRGPARGGLTALEAGVVATFVAVGIASANLGKTSVGGIVVAHTIDNDGEEVDNAIRAEGFEFASGLFENGGHGFVDENIIIRVLHEPSAFWKNVSHSFYSFMIV